MLYTDSHGFDSLKLIKNGFYNEFDDLLPKLLSLPDDDKIIIITECIKRVYGAIESGIQDYESKMNSDSIDMCHVFYNFAENAKESSWFRAIKDVNDVIDNETNPPLVGVLYFEIIVSMAKEYNFPIASDITDDHKRSFMMAKLGIPDSDDGRVRESLDRILSLLDLK